MLRFHVLILSLVLVQGLLTFPVDAQNVDYFRTLNNGTFRNPALWNPFNPVPPVMLGPGGALDRAHFNLGQSLANTYEITDVNGVNEQLIIENDSIDLEFIDYEVLSEGVGSEASIVIGQSASDNAFAIFSGDPDSVLQSVRTVIASDAGSNGTLFVSGSDLEWTNSSFLDVGHRGDGDLVVLLGATINSGLVDIGFIEGSTGTVLVDGAESTLQAQLIVGNGGEGMAHITNGGTVFNAFATSWIGSFPGSMGTVLVEEGGSWSTRHLRVGYEGDGSLEIRSGGVVDASFDVTIGEMPGSVGYVRTSGSASNSLLLVNDDLYVGGSDQGGLMNGGTGELEIFGGTVDVDDEIVLFPNGSISLNSGQLKADSIRFEGGGEFNFNFGTLSVEAYHGDLMHEGGFLRPGASLDSAGSTLIDGDYTMHEGALLEIEIGGPIVGTEYDFVNVTGDAILNGQLRLDLINDFVPTSEQTFTVMNVGSGSLLGFFDNVSDNERLGVSFFGIEGSFLVRYGATSPNPNQVILSDYYPVFVLGDVNGDGEVNLLDVAPFVTLLSSGGYHPAADINEDGVVNLLDVALFVALLTG